MRLKIYIAGKITGDPDYAEKFNTAAREYENKGYIVLNPAMLPEGMLPSDYMRICLSMIDTADVVAFLPGMKPAKVHSLSYSTACTPIKACGSRNVDTMRLFARATGARCAPGAANGLGWL